MSPAGADAGRPLPRIAADLVRWQRAQGRHGLPWQHTRDPYRVWLSEVMLQQTQVTTVLGYYERFLARWPDVAALAAAPLDDVLGQWSGLGYYSRARHLHRCAQAVVADHGGRFPQRAAVLATLPGIGPSTAAAIASFCFDERVAILDGNVKRVLARVLAFDGDIGQSGPTRTLWRIADQLLPEDSADMPAWTQGVMDLGATVCTPRKPQCGVCPLTVHCAARASGRQADFPVKEKRLKRGRRESWCLWLQAGTGDATQVWLQQRAHSGIWAGLWTWPLFDDASGREAALSALLGEVDASAEALPSFKHVLTHLDWLLHPLRVSVQAPLDPSAALGPGRWFDRAALATLGLPAPIGKALSVG
ncbi:A/G-specific adenine glycosylase [Sphaerotilus mobilis]|uniref:Adenine DNA glycosylase n=1 Tax=Sphaerotilus mobilis TaxID=47994 RepID=A0A4Q7LI68_9BURK|nr:A/G-specific adenine glycosylase [Sphaerotilus mobilis]RZS53158.1 A/G-specific DNA-adenine glycosylase [Sphaerotilus mobilis]